MKSKNTNRVWTERKAKISLTALIDRVFSEGPQTITRNGRKVVVVVAAV